MSPSIDQSYKCIMCGIDVKELKGHFSNKHPNHKVWAEEIGPKRNVNELGYTDLFYDRDADFKRRRAEPHMKAFGLNLINIDLEDRQNSFKTSALVNEKTAAFLKKIQESTTNSLKATVVLPHDDTDFVESFKLSDLETIIKKSHYPHIEDILGPYVGLNNDIEEEIDNLDLCRVVKIFPGSIIASIEFSLLVLTAEIYSRNGFMDAHSEKSGDSFPESIGSSSKIHQSLKICVIKESEGGGPIYKLNIGTKKFNVLVTGSLIISPTCENPIAFGPQCHPLLLNQDLNTAQLFLQKKKIKENSSQAITSSSCRQLNSAFGHKSTYLCYRSNLFENNLRQPATLFTLYMLPNSGYGSSSSNSCREISYFFSFVFECCHGLKNTQDIDTFFDMEINDKKLNEILINIKRMIEENKDISILQALTKQKGVSSLAQSLSGPLSLANKKLAEATYNYVQGLFN